MACYDGLNTGMQSDHSPQRRQPEPRPRFVFSSAQPPTPPGLLPPPEPDILLIEAADEAAAKAHFQALLEGRAAAPVRRAVPGVFLTTVQESGRWWRFRSYIAVA